MITEQQLKEERLAHNLAIEAKTMKQVRLYHVRGYLPSNGTKCYGNNKSISVTATSAFRAMNFVMEALPTFRIDAINDGGFINIIGDMPVAEGVV